MIPKWWNIFIIAFFVSSAQAQIHYAIHADQSQVRYYMEHPMHKWDAVSKQAKGNIEMGEDLTPNKIEITIPVVSFRSDNSNRDSHMAETVESYIYPEVVFVSTKITREKYAGDTHRVTSSWKVEGQLTFHGVTKDLSVPVAIVLEDKKITASSEFELKLTDFQIELPSLLLLPVKDWIKITFSIEGETAQSPNLGSL
jgi:polyisoprenoid-binding protein YceI